MDELKPSVSDYKTKFKHFKHVNEKILQELQSFFIIPNQQEVINVHNEKCIMTDDEKEV
jgi:phosphopantetheine adenylyltransferase